MIGPARDLADIRILIGLVIVETASFEQNDTMIAIRQAETQGHASSAGASDADVALQFAITVIASKIPYHLVVPTIDLKI